MAVDASVLASASPRRSVAERVAAVREVHLLATLVAVSAVARFVAALPHSVPRLYPDEYIYTALARSLSHGSLQVRGQTAHFPALLEPLVTAPLWWAGGVDLPFRLVQAFHAVVISLVAMPVWLLARRLGLTRWQRLACAFVAVASPSLLYASYMTADALGLTLAVSAVYAAVVALERSTARAQLAFLALAALATLARIQYVVLVVAFLVGAVAVSGNPFAAAKRFRATLVALAVPVLAVGAVGPARSLGYYHTVLRLGLRPGTLAGWVASDLMLLVYASGVVLVPAAVVGMAVAAVRPRDERERTFAVMTAALAALLVAEAGLYASNGSDRFQERYLMSLLPLVPLLFFVGMRRMAGRGVRLCTVAGGLALLLLAARVPLSGYIAGFGIQDSPLLQAVYQLERITSVASGSLSVGLAAGALALVAVLAAVKPRVGTPVAVAVAAGVLALLSVGSVATDIQKTQAARKLFPADPRWVDHSRLNDVAVLVTPGALRAAISSDLFWNESLTGLLQMRGADEVDVFGATPTRIDRTGALLAGGKPVSTPLLVDEYASSVDLSGASLVHRERGASLWDASSPVHVAMLTYGRYLDGWMSWPKTRITVWPAPSAARRGAVCLELSLPAGSSLDVTLRGAGIRRSFQVDGQAPRLLAIPVDARRGPWHVDLGTAHPLVAGDRLVSAIATRPRFVAGTFADAQAAGAACR